MKRKTKRKTKRRILAARRSFGTARWTQMNADKSKMKEVNFSGNKMMNGFNFDKVKNAKKESKQLDFKEKLDVNQAGDWCEIIKDIVAMANSGGGCLLIGVKDDGTPSGWDGNYLLEFDPAMITDKIAKYTGEQYDGFEIQEVEKNGYKLVAIMIDAVSIPLIFIQQGNYDIGEGKQKSAFSKGTIYFRHGTKSEPGNNIDLRDVIEKEIKKRQKLLNSNLRKVVNAPSGYQIKLLPPEVTESSLSTATPIRIVDDPKAPAYRKLDYDQTYPYRQKEVLELLNQKLNIEKKITTWDFQCIRKVFRIDESKPDFFGKSKFGPLQYSNSFVNWLVEQYKNDQLFFEKTREKFKNGKNESI